MLTFILAFFVADWIMNAYCDYHDNRPAPNRQSRIFERGPQTVSARRVRLGSVPVRGAFSREQSTSRFRGRNAWGFQQSRGRGHQQGRGDFAGRPHNQGHDNDSNAGATYHGYVHPVGVQRRPAEVHGNIIAPQQHQQFHRNSHGIPSLVSTPVAPPGSSLLGTPFTGYGRLVPI